MTFSVRNNKYKSLKFHVHVAKIWLDITWRSEIIFYKCAFFFPPKKDIKLIFSPQVLYV